MESADEIDQPQQRERQEPISFSDTPTSSSELPSTSQQADRQEQIPVFDTPTIYNIELPSTYISKGRCGTKAKKKQTNANYRSGPEILKSYMGKNT